MEKKKKWVQPKLVVLARGRPEEGVLIICKEYSQDVGPHNIDSGCTEEACYYCSAPMAS